MKRAILTACFACTIAMAFGQALYLDYPSVYLKVSTGAAIPFNKLNTGHITDHLIQFDVGHSYIEYFTAGIFFGKHFGFEFNFLTGTSEETQDGIYDFNTELEEMYGDNYYIKSTNRSPTYDPLFKNGFDKFSVSALYRISYEKFLLMPKLSLGYTAIPLHGRNVTLKEINSNDYMSLTYWPDDYKSYFFTFGTGITVGLRLMNQLVMTLDLQYNCFRMDFNYEIKTRILLENSSSIETVPYIKNVHSTSIGIGLIYELKYAKTPNPKHPSYQGD